MDLFKELIRLNNRIEIQRVSENKYEIDSEDDDEDIEYIRGLREDLMKDYDKVNHRQFKLSKKIRMK